jgi:glyoxylase-like metal-dependent hydrolase (beta-lactamase superfamily II)
MFIAEVGRSTLAVAVLGGVAACAAGPATTGGGEAEPGSSTTGSAPAATSGAGPTTSGAGPTTSAPATVDWRRVNLGFVSAYLLSRSGEVAVVDTGVPGSAAAIEQALFAFDFAWDAVSHVILTHRHNDHVGSLTDVLDLAASADGFCGAGDLDAINSPRALTAVGDGDAVFGLDVIETPGHTPGHIAVLDPVAGLLLAGDALHGADGGVAGARPEFTDDMTAANQSIVKLAGFSYEIALFGHGEPVLRGASRAVADLAAAS